MSDVSDVRMIETSDRCPQTWNLCRCVKAAGHPGPHYAVTGDWAGVAWGALDADGWPR